MAAVVTRRKVAIALGRESAATELLADSLKMPLTFVDQKSKQKLLKLYEAGLPDGAAGSLAAATTSGAAAAAAVRVELLDAADDGTCVVVADDGDTIECTLAPGVAPKSVIAALDDARDADRELFVLLDDNNVVLGIAENDSTDED